MSPTFARPGVYITEQLLGPTPPPLTVSPSVAAFVGEHWRGPTTYALMCNSWSDFQKYYGGFNPTQVPVLTNPNLAYSVYEFFANGGQSAWILRLQASLTPGTSASLTLKDSQATPVNTLTLTAGVLGQSGNVGTWGNNIYIDIVANPSIPGTGRFNINVYYNGTTVPFVVERWVDLSMNPTDSRYVVSILNSPTQGSNWIVATNLNDPAASPNNQPAVQTGTRFTGGVDAASPSNADYITALTYGSSPPAPLDQVAGVLNMNIPGNSTVAVLDAAIAYAAARPFTFLVMDPPSGQTPAGAVSFLASLSPVSSYAALYYPWLNAINPATNSLQATTLLPPGGFVLGQMAAIDGSVGVWQAPAGLNTNLDNVVSAERMFSPSDLDTLNSANVDALRTRPNGQVVIWGARTMQTGYASIYVPIRRTLNYIEASLSQLLEFSLFQPNDALLWTSIAAICNQFLAGLWGQNAFAGNNSTQAYYVICNSSNNTPQTISQGIVNTTVGVALLYPAEFINLTIAQFQSTGATTVTSIT
jgi:hypothetical protein